jgi:hypothetical protein
MVQLTFVRCRPEEVGVRYLEIRSALSEVCLTEIKYIGARSRYLFNENYDPTSTTG